MSLMGRIKEMKNDFLRQFEEGLLVMSCHGYGINNLIVELYSATTSMKTIDESMFEDMHYNNVCG